MSETEIPNADALENQIIPPAALPEEVTSAPIHEDDGIDDLSDVFDFVATTWEEQHQHLAETRENIEGVAQEIFRLAQSPKIISNIRESDTGYTNSMQTFVTSYRRAIKTLDEIKASLEGKTGRVDSEEEFSLHNTITYQFSNIGGVAHELLMTAALITAAALEIEAR